MENRLRTSRTKRCEESGEQFCFLSVTSQNDMLVGNLKTLEFEYFIPVNS